MTDYLRNTRRVVSQWSRERRVDTYGGSIPAQWEAQCIDLDSLIVEIDGEPCLVGTAGSLWVQYDKIPFHIISLVETKNPGEHQGAQVTYQLARDANINGYCVTLHNDHLVAVRHDGEQRVFSSVKEFVAATHVNRRNA